MKKIICASGSSVCYLCAAGSYASTPGLLCSAWCCIPILCCFYNNFRHCFPSLSEINTYHLTKNQNELHIEKYLTIWLSLVCRIYVCDCWFEACFHALIQMLGFGYRNYSNRINRHSFLCTWILKSKWCSIQDYRKFFFPICLSRLQTHLYAKVVCLERILQR